MIDLPGPLTAQDRADIQVLTRIAQAADLANIHAQRQVAATLAAGIISASGRAHSVSEALVVFQDVHFAMNPDNGNGRYKAWKETADLEKPHA